MIAFSLLSSGHSELRPRGAIDGQSHAVEGTYSKPAHSRLAVRRELCKYRSLSVPEHLLTTSKLHSSSVFLNPYGKRYTRNLILYRNGSHYIETGYQYCKSSYRCQALLTAFSNFCAASYQPRRASRFVRKCIYSWAYLHNESGMLSNNRTTKSKSNSNRN